MAIMLPKSMKFEPGAGTSFQRARGIEDSPENLFRHYLTLNQWKVDASVVRRLAEETGPSIEWLAEMGVEILDVYYSGDEIVPRGLQASP